jgi:hypothetical protein
MLPHWKGVLLTSQAELKERLKTNGILGHGNESSLPWINIKFFRGKVEGRIPNHLKFQEIGIIPPWVNTSLIIPHTNTISI